MPLIGISPPRLCLPLILRRSSTFPNRDPRLVGPLHSLTSNDATGTNQHMRRARRSRRVGVVLLRVFGMLTFVAVKLSPCGDDYEKALFVLKN